MCNSAGGAETYSIARVLNRRDRRFRSCFGRREVVGGGAARRGAAAAGRARSGGRAAGRSRSFFGPFEEFFDPRIGRPSTPMEMYLRLMFLKFRYRMGYETLCREVGGFVHLAAVLPDPVRRAVPHPTTLMKLTTRCGPHRGRRVEPGAAGTRPSRRKWSAPTGSGPTPRWSRRTWRTRPTPACWPRRSAGSATNVKRIHAAGGAVRTRVRDRSRSAGAKAHGVASEAAVPRAAGSGRGQGRRAEDHRGAGRPGPSCDQRRAHRCWSMPAARPSRARAEAAELAARRCT